MDRTDENRAVKGAAAAWVERIHDDPGHWADDEDEGLIRAVLAAEPTLRMRGEDCTCASGACGPTYAWDRYRP